MRRLLIAVGLALALTACQGGREAEENLTVAQAFLADNARKAGVKTLPSGVQYEVVKAGPETGLKPKEGDLVKVHYEGRLISGEVFDSSYDRGAPAVMELDGLIPAWIEALQQMRPGDDWTLYVPPEQGYGDRAAGPIPPNSVMIFRIELIDVLPASYPLSSTPR
ncbi:MAG TPA: FKBP-type peptidyl-prolyl cis-trans isomerase [Caulobacteraceae bacterium]|nr:FKBP-type peptidyl-prolyl cis-trans isomerase [Caulobacteraceae bacterium]